MIPDAMPCPTCKAPACLWLASYHDQGFRNANPWCHAVSFTEQLYGYWCAACQAWVPLTEKLSPKGVQEQPTSISEPVAQLGDSVTVSIGDDTITGTITDNPETDTEPSPTTPPCPVCANPLVKPFDFPKGSGEWFCPACIDWFGPVTGEPHIKTPTPSPEHPEPAQEIGPSSTYPHTGSGILYWEDTWHVVHVIDDMEHLLLRYMAGLSVRQKNVRRLLKQSTRLSKRAKKALDCGL